MSRQQPIFKISLPGIDVDTASPEECAVHSGYSNPKINKHAIPKHRGLVAINFNATVFSAGVDTVIYSIPHGYTYVPMVWAVVQRTDASNNIFGFQPFISGLFSVSVKSDNKNMYIIANSANGVAVTLSLLISYAIFAEDGAINA